MQKIDGIELSALQNFVADEGFFFTFMLQGPLFVTHCYTTERYYYGDFNTRTAFSRRRLHGQSPCLSCVSFNTAIVYYWTHSYLWKTLCCFNYFFLFSYYGFAGRFLSL